MMGFGLGFLAAAVFAVGVGVFGLAYPPNTCPQPVTYEALL